MFDVEQATKQVVKKEKKKREVDSDESDDEPVRKKAKPSSAISHFFKPSNTSL